MDEQGHDGEATEPTPSSREPGRARRLAGRGVRLALGPVVVSAALFGAVFATAGSESPSVSGAQPIDYQEECTNEGCANEEVKELWRSFKSECIDEDCWMEEVGELGGSPVRQRSESEGGGWYYGNDGVRNMLQYFQGRLDHWQEVESTMIRPGMSDTFGHRVLNLLGSVGDAPIYECDLDDGQLSNCGPPNPFD